MQKDDVESLLIALEESNQWKALAIEELQEAIEKARGQEVVAQDKFWFDEVRRDDR